MLGDVLDRVAREVDEGVLEGGPLAVELVETQPVLGHELGERSGSRPGEERVDPVDVTMAPAPASAAITSVSWGVRTWTRPSSVRARSSLTLVCAIRRPRPITTSSSAMPSSSPIRWLDTSTARPSAASSRRNARIQRIPSGSSR